MLLFIATILVSINTIIIITYIYIKFYIYNYWKGHKIPYEKPYVPFGNIPFCLFKNKIGIGEVLLKSYEKFKQYPFHGFYVGYQPIIMINDPQLIRTIFNKEFASFHSHGWFSNKNLDPLTNNIFHTNDNKYWLYLRNKLTPTFTPAKLRKIFSLITKISDELIDVCNIELERNNPIDVKIISKGYALDVISSLIFRCNYNCLKNPNNDFYNMAQKSLEWGNINMVFAIFMPKILEILRRTFYHQEIIVCFLNFFKKILRQQDKEPNTKNDIMNALLEIMDNGTLENDQKSDVIYQSIPEQSKRLSVSDVAATAHLILLAGYDTTSIPMAYCLYELTVNPEIMEKLQNEIDQVAESPSGFTYESITDMEYLDKVVSETLRKYPPVQFFTRISNKDFLIPGSNYTIPKGMRVVISSLGVHQNPEFFPDPKKFDPERYNKQNPDNKRNFVDLTFGEGPRSCIGKKLGFLVLKLGIVKLLYNYNIILNKDLNPTAQTNTGNFLQELTDLSLYLEKRKKYL